MLKSLLIGCCLVALSVAGDLIDNRYDGLMVYVDNEIDIADKEVDNFLDNLKDLLSRTSAALYVATGRRIYLGNTTIVIPYHWEVDDAGALAIGSKSKYDVMVTEQGYGGKVPFTPQGGMCKGPGLVINIPKDYVMDEKDVQSAFGDSGKFLANEFLKLKFGVYDEFGLPGSSVTPHGFMDQIRNEVRVTSCTDPDKLEGKWVKEDGDSCTPSETNQECRMEVSDSDADFSTLFLTHIDSINEVCDNDRHDFVAPTFHNMICSKSVLDVVLEHTHFQDGSNEPGDEDQETEPIFEIVRFNLAPAVILIDVDASIENEDDVMAVNEAINNTINAIVEEGLVHMLGIAYYYSNEDNDESEVIYFKNGNETEEILFYIQEIDMEELNIFLEETLQPQSSSSSSASSLLKTVISDIDEKYDFESETNVILTQTERETENFEMGVTKNSYVISSVVYGTFENTSNNIWMKELCFNTSGLYFGDPNYDGIYASLLIRALTTFDSIITVYEGESTLGTNDSDSFQFYVDEEISSNIILALDFTGNGSVVVDLYEETMEKVYQSMNATFDEEFHYLNIEEDVASGSYGINITSYGEDIQVSISIFSSIPESEESADPVKVQAWTSSMNETQDLTEYPLALYISVRQGYSPVAGISVKLEMSAEGEKEQKIVRELKDDGLMLPDMKKEDGIYSAYLEDVDEFGMSSDEFSISANVIIESVTSSEMKSEEESYVMSYPSNPFYDLETPEVVFANFSRKVYNALYFTVSGAVEYNEPPSRITDFVIEETDGKDEEDEQMEVFGTWTSPGADFTSGKVKEYDVRYTYEVSKLSDFDSWTKIEGSDIKGDFYEPKEFGTSQNATFVLKKPEDEHDSYGYMAIRGIDKEGNAGSPSPIASFVALHYNEYNGNDNEFVGSAGFIILIIFIVFIVLGAIGGGAYYYMEKKGKRFDDIKSAFKKNNKTHNNNNNDSMSM